MSTVDVHATVGQRSQLASRLIAFAIVAMWIYGWGANLILTLQMGRYLKEGLEVFSGSSPLSNAITTMLIASSCLALSAAIALSFNNVQTAPLSVLAALLIPWIILYPGLLLADDMRFSYRDILFPLFATAVYFARPTVTEVCRLIAILATITAGVSIMMGVLFESVALMPAWWNVDKSIIGGSALAGPYGHSNQLGTILALSIPFTIGTYRGPKRAIYLLVILTAMTWSASRSSLASAATFGIISMIAVMGAHGRHRRIARVYLASIWGAVLLAIWLPLTTADPLAYTARGKIWQASLSYWSEAPWFGWGPDVLETTNRLTLSIGSLVNTAHNVWLTFATTGGVITLTFVIIAAITITIQAAAMHRRGDARPMMFIVMLALMAIAEDPVRALHMGPQSFIVWSGLALTMCIPDLLTPCPEPSARFNVVDSGMPHGPRRWSNGAPDRFR